MSGEIRQTVRVEVKRDDGFKTLYSHDKKLDQSAASPSEDSRRISVATSEADLTFQNVATAGVVLITNLEAIGGNFITYGPKSGGAMVVLGKLQPQETHVLRLDSAAILRWKADTAAVAVQLEVADE